MEQEKGNFKGRVFGGFNRRDVIAYIEQLARERNELEEENRRLKDELAELRDRLEKPDDGAGGAENADVPENPDDSGEERRRELEDALREARETLSGVRSEYDSLCADVKVNTTQAEAELRSISAKLSGLNIALRSAGRRLEEIAGRLEQ